MKKWFVFILILFTVSGILNSTHQAQAADPEIFDNVVREIVGSLNNPGEPPYREGEDWYPRPPTDREGRDRRDDRRGDREGRGREGAMCAAYDRGHEEHFNGHDSCRSCLREHASCVERCEVQSFICGARGADQYRRFHDSPPGQGWTQEQAAREALRNCEMGRLRGCEVVGCEVRRENESLRPCGPPPPPPPRR